MDSKNILEKNIKSSSKIKTGFSEWLVDIGNEYISSRKNKPLFDRLMSKEVSKNDCDKYIETYSNQEMSKENLLERMIKNRIR